MASHKVDQDPMGVVLSDALFEDSTFASLGAATYPVGLILGRVTASGKVTPYVSGAADGSEVPTAVLMEQIVAAGVADFPTRVMVHGKARAGKLIVNPAAVPTATELDQLRAAGVVSVAVGELNIFDN